MKTDPLKDYKIGKKIEDAQSQHLALNFELAKQMYLEVLAEAPDSVSALRGMGILDLQQSRLREGEQWLRKAVALSPDDAQLWNDLGEALRMQGRFAGAIESYEKALEINPELVQTLNNLGAALMLDGNLDGSERQLRAAIVKDPANPYCHNTLGILLEQRALPQEALQQYELAVRLEPDFEEACANYSDLLARYPELIGVSVSRLIGDMGGN